MGRIKTSAENFAIYSGEVAQLHSCSLPSGRVRFDEWTAVLYFPDFCVCNLNFFSYLCTEIHNISNSISDENMAEKEVRTYHCNDCGNTIYRHEVFCSKCGKLLDRFDFED